MDDQFMYLGLRKPRPALIRKVREGLRGLERTPRARWELRLAACAASVALVVSLAVVPSMRAGAQAFLDLFRVVNFVALPVKSDHIGDIARQQGLDIPRMISEQVRILKPLQPPQSVATPEAAGVLAGMRVLVPTQHPGDVTPQLPQVVGDQAFAITASAQKVQRVEEAFGIEDLPFPPGIDGKTATFHIHPVVNIAYTGEHRHALLIESRQPDVSLPAGLDLARLAEIGLRVIGMNSTEAYRFAQQIDWRTTMVVPVPADAFDLREVEIQGNHGLLIRRSRIVNGTSIGESQLLWATTDAIFALGGDISPQELLLMAQSMQ